MEFAKTLGYLVGAAIIVGILLNFKDIRRYVHMSRM
jgi:hypothetical protein